jgi:hypothetical protein
MTDLTNLIDIDSDSDIENPTEYNEMFDKLSLVYYPDPYNTFGQIIMSAISGASISYIVKLQTNKPTNFESDINAYFLYCKNTSEDDYICEIMSQLKLNTDQLVLILDQLQTITINIMRNLIDSNTDLFNRSIAQSASDFNIDLFSADILKLLIPMIKYSLLSNIKTK